MTQTNGATKRFKGISVYQFEICELIDDDGYWHICHKDSTRTKCGKPAREASPFVDQCPAALRTLKDDPACCVKCRVKLLELFR